MKYLVITTAALGILGACSTPNPPSVTRHDVNRAYGEARRIEALPFTEAITLPTGSVIYNGQVGANVYGEASGSILGDMRMEVDFRDGDIDGDIRNINLIDMDGTPNQRFDGSLDINGRENNGDLDATAKGRLTGVDINNQSVDTYMDLDLIGEVRDDRDFGDAVYGEVDGIATGDFNMTVDGVFFGTAD
ncbi:hypothetical protein ACJ5NV_19015 [Loktanella agnita]|uniref:hypothetical protein n=1 Tax=Loktanella agnita TaxID=287097 RepID=UPI00398A3A1B